MNTPQGILEGQSITRPPYFNGQHYGWWKKRMENYIQAEDYELWMLIKNGPLIPKRIKEDDTVVIKKLEEFDSNDFEMIEKNAKPRNFCTLVLVQMSIHVSQSVNLLRTFRKLYK